MGLQDIYIIIKNYNLINIRQIGKCPNHMHILNNINA